MRKNLRPSNRVRAAAMAASKTMLIVVIVAIVAVGGITAMVLMGGSSNNDGPSIVITAPTAGSSHAPGTSLIIHWISKGNVGETVKIQVSFPGGDMYTIAAEASNNGTYVIGIPMEGAARNDFFVRVTSNLNASIYGESGQFTIGGEWTPTISYSYQELTKGNITFTIEAISRYDVPKSAVAIEVTPSVGNGHISGWSGVGENLAEDDSFTVGWMLPGATYHVAVRYLPTMDVFLDTNVLTEGTSAPSVGQYVNYTVGVIINNATGTHEGQGYLRIIVTSVNATTILYNSTLSVTIESLSTFQQTNKAMNWSTEFGGFGVKYPPAGTNVYVGGDSDVSTPWGPMGCKQYEVWKGSDRIGLYWMLDSVMLQGSKVTYGPGSDETISYQINDTNIISVTG